MTTILITGGTGFLGRALVRHYLKKNVDSIRIFSRDEVKQHKLQEEFSSPKMRHLLGDVRDYDRLQRATKGADIVIHAAALKRLDLLEYNVEESIKTNILGTLNVVRACIENNVKKMVFVSTDKACSPVNTYGACKFVSERIVVESNYSKGRAPTILTCVRYGNVLESTGSVIPFFEEKIKKKEKIPVTDSRMSRFIISHDQAVQLIEAALEHGVGGEIFVPKLPAFNLMDLIQLLKEKHSSTVETKKIGLRPGEKIHELMINSSEGPRTYSYKDMYVISSQIQKYHAVSKPRYMEEANLLGEREYSSADAIVSIEELRALFAELGLL